jgi:hypothetical protein|tara:strand:- start:342 stop:512 length:171 start_codon:yes stop_codon:yes gene_type:complete
MSYNIDENCISCGKCEKQCLDDAIYIGDDQFLIDLLKCTNCGLCLGHCPVDAIKNT